jgi:hypothetical protein
MASSYPDAFSPSFLSAYSLPADAVPQIFDSKTIESFKDIKFDASTFELLDVDAYSTDLGLASTSGEGWKFICAPEDISWDTSNAVNRIGIFGTNNPPVVSGSRGMRDLSLGSALVEGFTRNVTIETKIQALENLLNYDLNTSDGFVSVPVYQIWANQKAYGNSGYFVMKDVKVKESMRDLKGDATRATVDVSFVEVPEYQVNSGRDLASQVASAVKARALPDPKDLRAAQQAAALAQGNQGVGTAAKPAAGAGAGGEAKPVKTKPDLNRQNVENLPGPKPPSRPQPTYQPPKRP